MDFERAVIKSLFYDYPVESAVKAILELKNVPQKDEFISILPQFVRWRETAFTTTEAQLMQDLLPQDWFTSDTNVQACPNIYKLFELIKKLAGELITVDNSKHFPQVKYEELFRWRDLQLFVGEDLFTCAYFAYTGKSAPQVLNWSDMIEHTNEQLNQCLDKGLSDVHAHFNASADIFHLNWVNATNALQTIRELSLQILKYQEIRFVTPQTSNLYSLERMCLVAAWLRMRLFKLFVLEKEETEQDLPIIALNMLQDECFASIKKEQLQAEISVYRTKSLHTVFGRAFDYALNVNRAQRNVGILFHGERNILYQFLCAYYDDKNTNHEKAISWAPYFYLYLLIKTNIRKEFVQINPLNGFENFQTYQDRKSLFLDNAMPIKQIFSRYVAQTTLRNKKDSLEARVTLGGLRKYQYDKYNKCVFVDKNASNIGKNKLTFVVHMIKLGYGMWVNEHEFNKRNHIQDYCRYYSYRKELEKQINEILTISDRQKQEIAEGKQIIPIVGIDAASTEMFCRPEVFGHVFRYARTKGLSNQTYHVGEDFFDIVDGLRAIDEAIRFLELDKNSRIGHALVLGTDAKKYYENRHFRIIAPRQNVLDNFVWIYKISSIAKINISSKLEKEILKKTNELFGKIGYEGRFDLNAYWNSMLLRGDDPNCLQARKRHMPTFDLDWENARYSSDKKISKIRNNDNQAMSLYLAYHFNQKVKEEGDKIYQGKYEDATIIELINNIQVWLQKRVIENGIAIECNPSSNIKIGNFERYEEHPITTRFYPALRGCKKVLNTSINTDDRGVFATSLYEEFSLVALALIKQKKHRNKTIYNYIERVRANGIIQRFKID